MHVADQLETLITSGGITVGQKLPTENGLCESFGVSRTVIREAITHLKSLGLVETRRGVGTTVIRTSAVEAMPAERISPTTVEDILHVLELRLNLEPAAAELAARRHDENDRRILQEKHDAFIRARAEKTQARTEDYEFHYAIAAATKNPFFKAFYEQLSQSVIPRAKLMSVEINTAATDKYLARVEEEHTYILEAILARDPETAREMMYQHLNRARNMYAKFQEA
ncbi:DNA-binding transcriptional regulator, FadR family [Modicisalibacter xianhensis]|uniref:DNA-binding transcriptional regulator, FadR family n=1 Tax=Modicisalibacter xianhensis TaxID=442341 RepID=A0A1I3BNP1_9GAMM|nr:DNA-binding transcriptional regulator, FadR family [Halomonas xianhensis]